MSVATDNRVLLVVGSTSPPKLTAVRQGYRYAEPARPAPEVLGVEVDMFGINEHPMRREVTIEAARHRAQEAIKQYPSTTYAVGLQKGFEEIELGSWIEQLWVVVFNHYLVEAVIPAGGEWMPSWAIRLICEGSSPDEALSFVLGADSPNYLQQRELRQSQAYAIAVGAAISSHLCPMRQL